MAKRGFYRQTFRELIEETRGDAAATLWERAKLASRLRRAAATARRFRSAQMLSDIKCRAIKRLAELIPDELIVTIDSDYQVGLLSVRWDGHGRMHLPATALDATRSASTQRKAG